LKRATFYIVLILLLNNFSHASAQNIQVNTNFTPQQLIEDILINSGCITDIQVTNVVGGQFTDGSLSFGYFNANGSSFPFEEGLFLSTGRLQNVPGPNDSLSDDDAPGWNGDTDLENALSITNTTNATIFEFDFIPNADNIRFRYLFASEEYQEGNPNTCRFSDAFAFLIRPVGGEYTNIALVPDTQTPVLVTTVHPEIPGGCPAINETYFGSFNGINTPINFNGQTTILTAESPVIPNEQYHIKLVIADEQNFRFDSAVFLEGNSFTISADLGIDRSFVTNSPLCFQETFTLDATPPNSVPNGYRWFRDGTLLIGETMATLFVSTPGIYSVEIDYGMNCLATDAILIEYADEVMANNFALFQCEEVQDGIAIFDLYNSSAVVTNNNSLLQIVNFFERRADAEINFDPIPNPTQYLNPTVNQIVFARVENPFGCFDVASVILRTTDNTFSPYSLVECSETEISTFATFDLSEITTQIQMDILPDLTVTYHETHIDAGNGQNELSISFRNNIPQQQTIFARIEGMSGCQGIAEVLLNVVPTPTFEPQETLFYCLDRFPQTIALSSGIVGNPDDFTYAWSTGATTHTIEINEADTYTVTVFFIVTIDGETHTCETTTTIEVLESELAQITTQVTPNYHNESNITVTAQGAGEYEFSLNPDSFYQDSNVFENVLGGVYTVFVRDKNGCGIASETVYVIDFPRVVTPNNDGFHDTWQVVGLNTKNLQILRVEIFDRYGKLLKVISPTSQGWNGTYNGNPLPSNDYWFVAHFFEGGTFKSHFTLKR
jgi:gliding motility-associated-like protein